VPNRIGVTSLTQPPQLRALTIRYDNELTEDCSDRLWALMGSLLHDVLEGYAEGLDNTIAEQKLEIEVDGWTVVGKYDLSEIILEGELLTDWKFTSIYALKPDEPVKSEWEAQINCYAYLLGQHGRTVTQAQIVAIGRDWSKSRAKRESDYPQKAVLIKPVNLWPPEQTLEYIKGRVALHRDAEKGIGGRVLTFGRSNERDKRKRSNYLKIKNWQRSGSRKFWEDQPLTTLNTGQENQSAAKRTARRR